MKPESAATCRHEAAMGNSQSASENA